MRRRDFITLVGRRRGRVAAGGAGTAAGDAGRRISPLQARLRPMPVLVAAFRKGLGEAGYTDGRNVAIEFRWALGGGQRQAS